MALIAYYISNGNKTADVTLMRQVEAENLGFALHFFPAMFVFAFPALHCVFHSWAAFSVWDTNSDLGLNGIT